MESGDATVARVGAWKIRLTMAGAVDGRKRQTPLCMRRPQKPGACNIDHRGVSVTSGKIKGGRYKVIELVTIAT